ncbi:MAG: UvrD-helicase domain-containing protein [Cupriavidus necator]
MNRVIFMSLEAVGFFQVYGPPPEEWFEQFSPDFLSLPSYIAQNGDVLIITPKEAVDLEEVSATALMATQDGLLSELRLAKKPEAFNRVLRISQSVVDQGITIPSLWKPYNVDSLIAVQTSPRATGERARLLFDRKIHGSIAGICYGIIPSDIDLLKNKPKLVDFHDLEARFQLLIAEARASGLGAAQADAFDLEINNKALGLGDSLQTWYESKLTTIQRQFCDFPLAKSVRVRGPAGSGKTIAMVVKMLRQFETDRKLQKTQRYALLTHSESTIELIKAMMRTMVSEPELAALTEQGSLLYVGTLYSLAFESLGAELRGVAPLSLDGRQGRELQKELLNSIFERYTGSNWIARKGGCSQNFITRFEQAATDAAIRDQFLLEILNEFACVLEPEGIARSARKRDEYIVRTSREPWRLQLTSGDERRVILDLHAEFRKEMREIEAISVDQLISDFDRFLDSNAWELTRSTLGFDAIFVDELHLLNRMERMLITSLVKDASMRPIVVMAEDLKQDIKRVGAGLRSWQQQLEGLADFSLNEVFRYTPQINDFLRAIDDFSPTLNLGEDWPEYQQQSKLPAGPKPDVKVFKSLREQYDAIFPKASMAAKKRKSGRTVAVLTCDYDNFKQYLAAGQYRDLFIPVESREDITVIPSRGTRFVLSMPEFVAGLQFEEVFLIDTSDFALLGGEAVGVTDKRRGLSTVYLGSSRAMKSLHLSALADSGGLPSFLTHAIASGACDAT